MDSEGIEITDNRARLMQDALPTRKESEQRKKSGRTSRTSLRLYQAERRLKKDEMRESEAVLERILPAYKTERGRG